ncbi:MAG: deoxyribonuclease IV, partial [Chloroflexota bacterium]
GSHGGVGAETGLRLISAGVGSVLAETPPGVRLVLENSSGGGDSLGSTLEDLARILDAVPGPTGSMAFCLDTAHLWGAGYDISTPEGVSAVLDRFEELIGLNRLALVHLNDSKSVLGSRGDRHQHLGAGNIGAIGLSALLRDARLPVQTTFVMETPGADEGYDGVNLRRARVLYDGSAELPTLTARALTARRSGTRTGPGVRRPG